MSNNLTLALAFLLIGFLLGLMLPKVFDRRVENRGQEPRKPVPPAPRRNYEPPFPPPRPK